MNPLISLSSSLIHELFPSLQVQKNCLLALCSDYILQDVPFDKLVYFLTVPIWRMSLRLCISQDNQCTQSGTAMFFQQIVIQLKLFSLEM